MLYDLCMKTLSNWIIDTSFQNAEYRLRKIKGMMPPRYASDLVSSVLKELNSNLKKEFNSNLKKLNSNLKYQEEGDSSCYGKFRKIIPLLVLIIKISKVLRINEGFVQNIDTPEHSYNKRPLNYKIISQ